jgi:DNA-binding NarL/FixJ family response regulator
MNPIRALIVDDHAIVAEGLERLLQLDGRVEVVGSVRSLHEARVLLARTAPDVVLLDLRLPDSQGVSTVSSVREACPSAKIVVLTGYDWTAEPEIRRLGVHAFLRKEAASDIIAQTVFDLFADDSHQDRPEQRLTSREAEVARLVSQGMTNPEIARTLYISLDTVKTHVAHIMRKLGMTRRIELSRWRQTTPTSAPLPAQGAPITREGDSGRNHPNG